MNASSLVWLCLLAAQADGDGERSTLESVDSTRGGRHWIDQKTQPPKSADESLKCFQIEPGAKIELVVGEPLVMDPVAIAFDHKGQMFVVEYGDYPTGPKNPDDPPLSRVVMIENAIEFGMLPKRHVFADNLKFCHSLMPLMDGILVGAQTQIVFLKDTDGDHKADVREVWFDGFEPAHPQMQIGNPRWGFDNRIYLNYGPGKVRMTRPGFKPTEPVQMPRKDFWFDPLTMEFGACSGLGQFGNTIDHRGYRFFTTNRNPIMVEMLPPEAVKRNPFAIITRAHADVGPSGGDTRVYPLIDMKSNYLSHAGTHTSACGVTAYVGGLFSKDYFESVFVCEPIGHLVTRTVVSPDPNSVGLIAKRARENADFLASSDTWFRPVSLATGPDGALYLADMYRLWVEHPKFLPPEIAARINWRVGEDRGRIWRIAPVGETDRPDFRPARTTNDLVALTTDSNGWRRTVGQRLLVERQDVAAAPKLRTITKTVVLQDGQQVIVRPLETDMQALWTLDGIDRLTWRDVAEVLSSPAPYAQCAAVRLAARFLNSDADDVFSHFLTLVDSGSPQVQFAVAQTLGESDDTRATQLLIRLAIRNGNDPWMASAIVTSCQKRSATVAEALSYTDANLLLRRIGVPSDLVRQLAEVTGARGDLAELSVVLKTLTAPQTLSWWKLAAVNGLATGLARHRGDLKPLSLARLMTDPPQQLAGYAESLRTVIQQSRDVALDAERSDADRTGAISLLTHLPGDESRETFASLLDTGQSADIQQTAISAMQSAGSRYASELVLEKWPQLGPTVQSSALELLLSRPASTSLALGAMSEGTIPASVVDIDRRVRLLRHSDAAIRKLAGELFGGAISANRKEVAKKYEAALSLSLTPISSAEAGAKVFQKSCIKCHKINGRGVEVGPDISDVRNRSREALLYDILDPNRKVEPRFMDYSVVTTDGRTFNGLMISETAEAVVLRQAEGKQQVISRNDIEILKASGRSLMPEGVEKDVTVQQMADLLQFLKSRNRPALDGSNSGGEK